jgi:predicted CxxxxCH...CXXCH cytochrome family protein
MRHAVLGAVRALSVAAVFNVGCSSPPPASNSFTQVYTTVIARKCSSQYCHSNGVNIRYSGLDMSSQVVAYWGLVDQPLAGPSCAQMGTRVIPFDPEASVMYLKVSQTMPPCGSQMPADPTTLLTKGSAVFVGPALSSDEQQLIYNWIKDGAQDN